VDVTYKSSRQDDFDIGLGRTVAFVRSPTRRCMSPHIAACTLGRVG
jgi:hypothetical protein